MCGECCSSWNIPIEGHKARALLEKDWVVQRLADTRRELVKVSDDLYRLPLTDENVCIFLAEDRRCLVEAHEGLALKPHECQRFPFATIKMPDGTARHDTSAACKLISEKLLLAFQPILPRPKAVSQDSLEDTLQELRKQQEEQFEEIETFPRRIAVGLFGKTELAAYEQALSQLHNVFADPAQTSEAALAQARQILLGRSAGSKQAGAFRFYPGVARAMVTVFLRKPYRTLSWFSLLRGKTYDDPRIFGFPIDLAARDALAWNPTQDHHVNAFLYNLLNRKLLIARGHSLAAMLAMASAACLLVRWYAVTLAWIRESRTVEHTDVTGAIRLVERYYTGHQPRFLNFFHARWKGQLLDWVLLGISGRRDPAG